MKLFSFPNQASYYKGKVREIYTTKENKLISICSDRISAFDHILPKTIPYKGQVLNLMAAHFLNLTRDIVPNWLEKVPHPNVSIGKACKPYKIEMVIRGYLAGHAWRTYKEGGRTLCGVLLPEGLKQNDPLPFPIITPATKADEGHDEDISREDIISKEIILKQEYELLEKYTYDLFEFGQKYAYEKGLILVDTKFEFGKTSEGEIVLIDEILTPDSSRYFYKDGYKERQDRGDSQKQLSKEFVREWLMENGFQGLEGQKIPQMSKQVVQGISNRYSELYKAITGKNFTPISFDESNVQQLVIDALG